MEIGLFTVIFKDLAKSVAFLITHVKSKISEDIINTNIIS